MLLGPNGNFLFVNFVILMLIIFLCIYDVKCSHFQIFWMSSHQTNSCFTDFVTHFKACADKIAREMKMFGNPPIIPVEEETVSELVVEREEFVIKDKSKENKSKAAA